MAPMTLEALTAMDPVADGWAEASRRFDADGIVVLSGLIDGAMLAGLRAEAAFLADQAEAAAGICGAMPARGETCRSLPGHHTHRPRLAALIASRPMRALTGALMGPRAYLFTEQFLIKAPKGAMDFNWHQDGGYVPVAHDPFLVVWIALDDVDEANGTIRAIPFGRMPDRSLRPHRPHPANGDLVAWDGPDQGDPVIAPAGSVVAFSSLLLHASADNRSERWRRVYQIRYTPRPVTDPATGRPLHFAAPLFGG
jgi:hypothetical protein